jgi:hypothetical protein
VGYRMVLITTISTFKIANSFFKSFILSFIKRKNEETKKIKRTPPILFFLQKFLHHLKIPFFEGTKTAMKVLHFSGTFSMHKPARTYSGAGNYQYLIPFHEFSFLSQISYQDFLMNPIGEIT